MAKPAYIGVGNFSPERKLPEGHKQLEYIELTGTQWIDTGYIPVDATEIYFDNQFTSLSYSSDGYSYSYNGICSNNRFHLALSIGANAYHIGLRGTWKNLGTADINRHLFYLNATTGAFKIDSEEYALEVTGSMPTGLTFWLGRENHSGGNYARQRTYGLRFVENGVTVHDFVPDLFEGAVGLYDVVTGTFHGNAGTGEIVAGPVYSATAQMAKKGYIGIDDVARNLKRAYIGDNNGIAQLCYAENTWLIPSNASRLITEDGKIFCLKEE